MSQFVDERTIWHLEAAGLLTIVGDEDTFTVYGHKEITVKWQQDEESSESIINRAVEKVLSESKGFELTKDQKLKVRHWQSQIRQETGKIPHLTYSFTKTGIGPHVTVKDNESGRELDLSEYDKW